MVIGALMAFQSANNMANELLRLALAQSVDGARLALFLDDPAAILHEMLRVGRRAIVSFPNWGYWRCRLHLLFTGCIPQAPDLSQRWHDVPRWQALTITDFAHFCRDEGLAITREVYVVNGRRVRIVKVKNLLATTAVFALEKVSKEQP